MAKKRDRLGPEAKRLVGARIRHLRGDLTVEVLADKAGLSSGALAQLERGESDPTLGTLLHLMLALELPSIEDLLGERPPSPSSTIPVV